MRLVLDYYYSDIVNPQKSSVDKDSPSEVSYQHGVIAAVVLVHAEGRVVGIRLRNVFNGRDSR